MTDAPERIWAFHDGPLVGCFVGKNNFGDGAHVAEYIRADLGSFYQEKDIDALMAERDNLRSIIRAFLACPHIADRDPHPWSEPETEAVVSRAHAALENTENDE